LIERDETSGLGPGLEMALLILLVAVLLAIELLDRAMAIGGGLVV